MTKARRITKSSSVKSSVVDEEAFDSGDNYGISVRGIDFKLSIYGVDVTDYCKGSISIERVGADSVGSLSFELDNNYDKFVMRSDNFNMKTSYQEDLYSRTPWTIEGLKCSKNKGNHFLDTDEEHSKNNQRWTYSEIAKKRIFERKNEVNIQDKKKYYEMLKSANIADTSEFSPLVYTYNLDVGCCVISRFDHVRLFVLNPEQDPLGADETKQWIPAFSGFVDNISKQSNPLDGSSSINITCTDIRGMMARKRLLTNAIDASASLHTDPSAGVKGLFSNIDLGTDSSFTNSLAGLTFEEVLNKLFLSVERAAELIKVQNISDEASVAIRGEKSVVDSINQERQEESNKISNYIKNVKYQNIMAESWKKSGMFVKNFSKCIRRLRNEKSESRIDNGYGMGLYAIGYVAEVPGSSTKNKELFSAWNKLTLFGVNYTWFTTKEVNKILSGSYLGGEFSCLKGFVNLLKPTNGTGISTIMDSQLIQNLGNNFEYVTALQVLQDYCTRIDYKMTVNGMGDILIEPPMYDLLPEDFLDFGHYLCAANSVIDSTVNDDTESNPCTCLKITPGSQQADSPNVDDEAVQIFDYTVIVKSDAMAEKYGFNMEEEACPYLTQSDFDSSKSKLFVYGLLEFTKKLAAMSEVDINAAYNPFLYPNRPFMAYYERRVATIESVSISLQINEEATTSVKLYMVRKIDTNGKITNLTGFEHTVFSLNNPDKTFASLSNFNNTPSDIRSKSGVEVFLVTDIGVLKKATTELALSTNAQTIAAIKTASIKTGISEEGILELIYNESSGYASATNGNSTASGLFQITMPTFNSIYNYLLKNRSKIPSLNFADNNFMQVIKPAYTASCNNDSQNYRNAIGRLPEKTQIYVWTALAIMRKNDYNSLTSTDDKLKRIQKTDFTGSYSQYSNVADAWMEKANTRTETNQAQQRTEAISQSTKHGTSRKTNR